MSREDQEGWRWLTGLRLVVSVTLLLLLCGVLVGTYHSQREEALQVAMTSLTGQFASRLQRLHGLWLAQQRPPLLVAEGRTWFFGEHGWPLAVGGARGPSEDCARLWLALTGTEALDGEPVLVLVREEGAGCEIRLGGDRWHYHWQDGRVTRLLDEAQ